MANKFDLDTIIAEEVKKAVGSQTPAPAGGILDGITLQDITNFLGELSKLKTQMGALSPQTITPAQPILNSAPIQPTAPQPTAPALNPEGVYKGIIQGIDMIVPIMGDVKLSELKTYMQENKDSVITLIGDGLK
jgi:hypothetical protein